MNNDLGFLIIFIILPTALIVSGFWLILFVKSDLRPRTVSEANTSAEATDEQPLADAEPAKAERAPVELPAPGFIVDGVADPVPSSTDDPIDEDDDEEFWTPAPDQASDVEAGPAVHEAAPAPDDAPEEGVSGDTANLPEHWEVDLDTAAEAPEADGDDDEQRLQRQPEARMIPSTEHVRRRTGQNSRRAPTVARSVARDEDAVESPDGS